MAFGTGEKEATKKLNDLASEGWELVSPLGNGLVAFRRPTASDRDAAKKELAKWQGEWEAADRGETLVVKGELWAWGKTGTPPRLVNSMKVVAVKEQMTHVDLILGEGEEKGKVCKAIFRVEGDTLHYCGTYNEARPTEFRTTESGDYLHVAWKRVLKK